MKANLVMLPDGRVLISVPDQPEVSFEEAAAAIRKLRAQLNAAGVPIAGEDKIETHLPTKEHEAVHQAEREVPH